MKLFHFFKISLPVVIAATNVHAAPQPITSIPMTNATGCILTFNGGPNPVSGTYDKSKESNVSFYYYPNQQESSRTSDKTLTPNESSQIMLTLQSPFGGSSPSIFYSYKESSIYGGSYSSDFLFYEVKTWYTYQTYNRCNPTGTLCLFIDAYNWCPQQIE